MAYQVLYRKYRPLVFDDVVGQDHVVSTLKNEIKNNKIAHAYLFCGTRGTGKTSVAKIFSRAINCVNNTDGNPCNECEVCKGVLDGSIMDVEELDAASNNKVEDIREIREKVIYSTSITKYKVFIIDEVHMLSTEAFNALLKTLEEPPEHVIFVLATTEFQKIPITILSRCQSFDFRRITLDDIVNRLEYIANKEELEISREALTLVAQIGDGSMRDSLSILDQCIASVGPRLSYDDVVKALGITSHKSVSDTADAIISGDSGRVVSLFNDVINQGKNASSFIDSLLLHFRDIMICKVTDDAKRVLNTTDEKLEAIKTQAKAVSVEKLRYIIETLSKALNDAKWSQAARTMFELSLIKCADLSLDDSAEAVLARVKDVEDKLANGSFAVVAAPQPVVNKAAVEKKETKPTPPPKPKVAAKEGSFDLAGLLDKIKAMGEISVFAYLKQGRMEWIDGTATLVFPDSAAINKTIIERPSNMSKLIEAAEALSGGKVEFKCVLEKELGNVTVEEEESNAAIDKINSEFPGLVEVID